ncbi:FAD/NAD(P)-binding protein [Geodermatophilus ruber]|uniref:FAD-NAD(P)-binding n=1 Tax=Geodermatophilus ruber TaxID=504800 RepID=A0A1I4L6X2_9ACTN|nr:FAD/NAD(P)-binding protein [Geodermatophilus ruber]SFL86730.1 FAD-NAD(P)-binding [Geodermatophilus ruber]
MSTPAPDPVRPSTVVVVGAGPTAIGVLERLVANAPGLSGGRRVRVHLVDPFPPGGGRVWRAEQPDLLWANSLVGDVTVLPDASVVVDGPVGEGTTLWEWVRAVAAARPAEDPVGREALRLGPASFPSRPLVNAYLSWVLERVAADAEPWLDVHLHATRAVDVADGADGTCVRLADGTVLTADVVLLAQGHLDARPSAPEQATAAAAARRGLTYVPTGYTADLDLSVLPPGEDVLVRGAGLAFVDLAVLLTSGRGGRFARGDDGGLRYLPSGREPVLHVGSRRGVPYRSKLGYPWAVPPVPLRFFTPAAVDEAFGTDRPLDLRADLAPLIARELGWAHYTELFRAHPERTSLPWEEFAEAWAAAAGPRAERALVARAVPDLVDRFDLAALDRPLAGRWFADPGTLQEAVRRHVRADLDRAGNPAFSTDAAVFTALLQCHGTIASLVAARRLTPRSEAEDLSGWWMNLFSYLASGPPGPRLEELLALSEAGVLRFLGADTEIALDEEAGVFRARSASCPGITEARALVDARLPLPDVTATTDPVVAGLLARGEARERVLSDPGAACGGWRTGRLDVDASLRLVTASGAAHPRVFAAGYWTAGAQVPAFARPRTDAPFFRQNDALARELWRGLDAARGTPDRAGDVLLAAAAGAA